MLINDKRALAYTERVTNVMHHPNADRLDVVHINGWGVITGRDEFNVGDLGVFFETDSRLPDTPPFSNIEFLRNKHFKVKIQKIRGEYSEGLFVPIQAFEGIVDIPQEVHVDCTELLGVTYTVVKDNKRKNNGVKPISILKQRRPDLFKKSIIKKLMKHQWGQKIILLLFGHKAKKVANAKAFPTQFEFLHKTDSERIENIPFLLGNGETYIASEKIDGTSSTYGIAKKKNGELESYVCSRNVRQLSKEQETFHERNVYWDMEEKYHILEHLVDYMLKNPQLEYVFIQGEIVGSVQGNPYKLPEDDLYVFSFIRSDIGTTAPSIGKETVEAMGMKWVPTLGEVTLPETMEEMKDLATGKSILNPEVMREGIVYRSAERPNEVNFKNVSREFLMSRWKIDAATEEEE